MDHAEALFFANPFWAWIALGVVLLIGELMTGSGWLLWPAAAAGVVAIAAHFVSWPAQIVLFAVTAIAATYVGRRFLRGAPKGERDINNPAQRVVGHVGETATPFIAGLGRVFVDGKEWAAELDGGGDLAAKAKVEVVAMLGGARLRVKAAA